MPSTVPTRTPSATPTFVPTAEPNMPTLSPSQTPTIATPQLPRVLFLYDSRVVDTEDDARNLLEAMTPLAEITLIEKFTRGSMYELLSSTRAQTLNIPEMEYGSFIRRLNNEDRDVIQEFTRAGGAVIVHGDFNGNLREFILEVYKIDIGPSAVEDSTQSSSRSYRTSESSQTEFEHGPDVLERANAIAPLSPQHLQNLATKIYVNEQGTQTWVAKVPYGEGTITFLAYSYAGFAQGRDVDRDWIRVEEIAVRLGYKFNEDHWDTRVSLAPTVCMPEVLYVLDDSLVDAEVDAKNLLEAISPINDVTPIENYFTGSMRALIYTQHTQIINIPELENGDFEAILSEDDKLAIRQFTYAGGALVVHGDFNGNLRKFLLGVFNIDIGPSAVQRSMESEVKSYLTDSGKETPFGAGPSQLHRRNAIAPLISRDLPENATVIYDTKNKAEEVWVATIPYGDGVISFIAYSFAEFVARRNQDADWLAVEQTAIRQGCQYHGGAPLGNQPMNSTCFAGHSTVRMENGDERAMKDIRVGDRIMVTGRKHDVASRNMTALPATVVFIPHGLENRDKSRFLEFQTLKGNKLTVTPDHLVLARNCSSDRECDQTPFDLMHARDLRVGMLLSEVDAHGVEGDDLILSIKSTTFEGIFTVVTDHPDGMLIVNNLKVSSFGFSHNLPNSLYHIHRYLFRTFSVRWWFTHKTVIWVHEQVCHLAMFVFGKLNLFSLW